MQRVAQDKDAKFAELEDALLPLENERGVLRQRLEDTNTKLSNEVAIRQGLQRDLADAHEELAQHRNDVTELEREAAKALGDIKARDDEVALLRSRENKTIVEHVHVLESAKKVTDRQLREQVGENKRLNEILKSLEKHRNRVQADFEDLTREHELLKKSRGREVRAARASLGPEDKTATDLLEEERKARVAAESRVAALERDLQDQRKRMSAVALSPKRTVSGSSEGKLHRALDELARLQKSHDQALVENGRLAAELDARSKQAKVPSSRAELLRGLQQSHEALGRDMNDQLRRLDSAPSTPSRRTNGH